MDFDAQKMNELLELTRENNKILRSMRSSARWRSFFRIAYWAVFLGVVAGVYYYFQPTIQKYVKTVQTSMEILQKFQSAAGDITNNIQSAKNLISK